MKAALCPGPDRPEIIEGLRMAVEKTGHLHIMKLPAMDDARRPQTRPDILALLERMRTVGLPGWKPVPRSTGALCKR